MGYWGARLLVATSLLAIGAAVRAGETITYSYDALGRLTGVAHAGTVNDGAEARYSYDPADNRTNVTVAAGPRVIGGGFELPEVNAGYVYNPPGEPPGGSPVFAERAGIAGNGSIWGFAAAPEGDQVAFIQAYGPAASIRLPVTRLTVGTSYTVRFRIAQRPNFGANPVTVAFDGIALGTFTPGSTAFTAVTTAAFTATAASGSLTFTGTANAADLATGLDFVTVAAAGSN